MAIPTPTVPSSLSAVGATSLHATQNNKAFYVYSGEQLVDNTETTMISINDIGKRDIMIWFNVGCDTVANDNPTIKVKVNGQVIMETQHNYTYTQYLDSYGQQCYIVPANCSLEITIQLSANSYHYFVSGYGYYLEGQ